MLALAEYRAEILCPLCGWPREVCQATGADASIETLPPARCHISTAISRAREAWQKAPNGGYPEALLWGVRVKEQQSGSGPLQQE